MVYIKKPSFRKALTMLELIFVIIILGIVSSIGAEIIANTYESYIIQRAQHRASIKTELAATQIANRLAHAIPGTIVRKSNLTDTGGNARDINTPGLASDIILQWVGADRDSFNAIASAANRLPGWSGFCDVDAFSPRANIISTPASNLALANTIITNLSAGNPKTLASASLYFPTISQGLVSNPIINFNNAAVPNPTITLNARPAAITEHYKLAWTSYALQAVNGNLTLHYNFLPIRAVAIANQQSELLLRNVSTFEFTGDGQTIRFKICVQENTGAGLITICKEKAVF